MCARVCVCVCRFDHITSCLSRVLDERPNNAVGEFTVFPPIKLRASFSCAQLVSLDVFENLSLSVKRERYTTPEGTLRDQEEITEQVEVAERQSTLYQVYTVYTILE